MPQSRFPRNVFVYDCNFAEPASVLVAGFFQFGQTTADEFYFYLEVCFQEPQASQFRLMDVNGVLMPRDHTIVATGSYYVVSPSKSPSLLRR